MIAAFFFSARAFLAKVPWQVWAAAAVLLTAWLWGNHRYAQGEAAVEARYAAARAQAVAQARKADGVAVETAQAGKAASEAEIDKGREAAKAGPDPWKQATEAMR